MWRFAPWTGKTWLRVGVIWVPVIHDPEKLIRQVGRQDISKTYNTFLESFSLLNVEGSVSGVVYVNPMLNVRVEATLRLDLDAPPEDGGSVLMPRAHAGPYLAWQLRGWCVPGATDTDRDLVFEVARVTVTPVEDIVWVPLIEYEAMSRHRIATFAQRVATQDAQNRLNEHFAPDAHIRVDQAGGVLPFQAEGKLNGDNFYFRFRSHDASLRVGGADPVAAPRWESSIEDGYQFFGDRTDMNGFVEAMKELVPLLAPPLPRETSRRS